MYQSRPSHFKQHDSSGQAQLSEILGAFSYALDLTEGQPAGHSIRACWIGTQIAMALGLRGDRLRDVYYAVLLKDLGCSSNAAKVSEMFVGDDRVLKRGFKLIGPQPEDFGAFVGSEVGAHAAPEVRAQALSNIAENGGAIMTDLMATRCSRGADIARQLRFFGGCCPSNRPSRRTLGRHRPAARHCRNRHPSRRPDCFAGPGC